MMDFRFGMENHKSRKLIASIVAVMLLGMAARESGAMTAHEKARAVRAEAVESARIAFEKAKSAGAERAAPYEYYTAEEYLNLAMEELSSGDKIGVAHFAAECRKYSNEALEKAQGGSK